MESIWEKYIEKKSVEKVNLPERTEKEVVVVGGGIAGFLAAYYLAESGQKVTLLEAEKLFGGVTKNTTAHINALQGKYKDIPTKKQRRLYFETQLWAVNEFEKLVNKHSIDCDFKRVDSFLFGNEKDLKKEYNALKQIDAPVSYSTNLKSFLGALDMICLKNQAVFNPIKFLQGLPVKFEIIENARVLKVSLTKKSLRTKTHSYTAKKIVFATNFPLVNIRGLFAFKLYKSISYAVQFKSETKMDAIYNSIEDDGFTYRGCSDGIIVGGLDHRTGRDKGDCKFTDLIEKHSLFDGQWETKWAANDCITFDSIPYAGSGYIAKDVYLISGFGKWGMTNAIVCANVICDIINKNKNEYIKLLNPKRILNLKVWGKVLFNGLYNVFNIFLSIFSGPRCPHMLCKLRFNKNTKTWDCPCHGSRFDASGKIIAEPTTKDISV